MITSETTPDPVGSDGPAGGMAFPLQDPKVIIEQTLTFLHPDGAVFKLCAFGPKPPKSHVWGGDASVRYIFSLSWGNPTADTILEALKAAPDGLTRTEINNLFGRNLPADRLQAAIGELLKLGLIGIAKIETGGRPSERFILRT